MSIANTLKRLSPPLYRLRIFVIIIAMLAVPFTLYYFFYIRSQNNYYTDRSFRKLSVISSQVASKVETACSIFKNTSDKFISPVVKEEGARFFDPDPAHKDDNLNGLKEAFKGLRGERQIIPLKIETEAWGDKVSPGTVTLGAVKYENDSSWLYLDYVADGALEKTVIRVQGKLDLNRLIQPFLSTRVGSDSDQFQNILIAESDTARVIFQHDTTQVRLTSLDKLPLSEDQAKKIDLKEIAQTSHLVDVNLAGSGYRLFSHPLKLSVPSNANASNTTWIASGLVKSNYFQTEILSISIPYRILIIGGFLVLLLVFSSPFLKLVLTGPKDRFRPKDVYFLIFSTMMVLALLTCFGLYVYVYTSVEDQMDDQVARLASDIKKNFNQELTLALEQLDTLSENHAIIKQLDLTAKNPKAKPKLKAHSEIDIYQQDGINKTAILPAVLKSPKTKYRYFDGAAWIDDKGMQKAKWSVKNYTTQYISVVGRAYFDNIRKGRFYELGKHKFWLEPIISRNTGRNLIEISKAVPGTSSWTLALDTRLLSLMDPVLPRGYGYIIIANDGKALFHSDEAHHLGENVFQECDEDPKLLSAVIGRSDKTLTVRYLGEDHSFFITTMKAFPDWSLIVYRNKQPLRSIFFELLTSVTVLFLIYGLILMAGFTVFYIINVARERRAWLWPSEKKTAIYIPSIILLLGLSVFSLYLIILLHGEKLIWYIAGIGFFSGVAYFINLRWGSKMPFSKDVSRLLNRFKVHGRLYVLNATLLLLLVAILPAGAFFKYAYESQITLFIKHAQYSIATALAKRDERIRSQYSTLKFTKSAQRSESENREEEIKERLNKSWDVYDNFFFDTNRTPATGGTSHIQIAQANLLAELNSVLPLFNRDCIERRGLLENSSVEGVGKWESGPIGRLVLHLDGNAGEPASPGVHLNTSVRLLGAPGYPVGVAVVLFVPLFLFVNFLVRKVFLLDTEKPASHSLKKLLSCEIDRNIFVVVNAPFVKKAVGKKSNLDLRDLPSLATSAGWADAFDYSSVGEKSVIALDQFDYGMDDPQINQQKLKLVENLLAKQRTMVLFSSAESSQYRFANGENGHANGERDGSGRWAGAIISNFFTEYAEDTDDGLSCEEDDLSFKKRVEQEKERILARDLQGKSTEEIDELFRTLYVECAPREPLQRVGLQILSQKGFVTLNREQLIERIGNQARAYYTHIWNSCSTGEKLTLCHLADDRLLSHRDPDIERLLRRELIVRDEDVHLLNESFRQFVRSEEQVSFVAEQDKQAQQASLWQTLKAPILVAMLIVTAFLFVTQRDLFSSSLALVTGLTTLLPAVFKVVSMFHTDSTSRAPN